MGASKAAPASVMLVLALIAASCGNSAESPPSDSGETSSTTTVTTVTTVTSATVTTTEVATTTSTEAPAAIETTTPADTSHTKESVTFRSGLLELAGDLYLPGGPGPHPAVIMVHSGGAQTRTSTPGFSATSTRFRDAGFALLTYDKPGSGQSTGNLSEEHRLTGLATILADAVQLLVDNPAVAADRIGVWGLSEAGWVMPLAMTLTDDIAFMVVVSGGGEDSIDQFTFQAGRQIVCRGATEEQGELAEVYGAQALRAASYKEYREAMEILIDIPGLEAYTGNEIASEEDWVPWPSDIDSFFDPRKVIEQTTVPVLAVFGDKDTQVDPTQGSEAYEAALQKAGNPNYHVEVISGVNHVLQEATTGCLGEVGGVFSDRYLELLEEWIAGLSDAP